MALTPAQKVTIAEITRKSYQKIDDREATWITQPEQITVLAADVVLWEANRNKLKVTLEDGTGGVNYVVKNLLDEIRIRTLVAFGFSIGSGVAGVFAGGISKADKEAREADTDRVVPAFTADLHSTF